MKKEIPKHFSWRGLPSMNFPVKNQRRCRCCSAVVVSGLVSQQLKQHNLSLVDFEAAAQELIDILPKKYPEEVEPPDENGCHTINPEIGCKYVQTYGITLESHYRFRARRQENREPPMVPRIFVDEVKTLYGASLKKIKRVIFQTPIAGRIAAHEGFRLFKGKKIYRKHTGKYLGKHSVMAIGYGVDKHNQEYLHIRNSCGIHWGNQGYARIRYKLFEALCYLDGAWIAMDLQELDEQLL